MALSTFVILSSTPSGGAPGVSVTLLGSGFGVAEGAVEFDPLGEDLFASITSWAPGQIVFVVPALSKSNLFVDVAVSNALENDGTSFKFWIPHPTPGVGTFPPGLSYQLPNLEEDTIGQNLDDLKRFTAGDFNRLMDRVLVGGGGGGLPPLPGNTGFPPVLMEEPTGVLIFRPLTSDDLAPPFAPSLSGGQVVEIGQSIIDPTFNATYVGGTPTSASLADNDGNPPQDVLGVPNPIARLFTYLKTALNASVDFTLTADDGSGPEVDIEKSHWQGRAWWGTGAAGGSTEAFIKALANDALDNNRQRTFTVNAGVGEKIYYAYPSAHGAATFTVGGFEGGFLPGVTISLTNAFGVTLDYLLYESAVSGLGSTEVVVS